MLFSSSSCISERLIKYFYLSESQHWTQPSTFCRTVYSFCCFWRTVLKIQENSASGGKRSHSVTLFTGFVKLTFTVGAGGQTLVWTNSYLPSSPHLLRLSFMMRIVPEFLAREHDDMLKRERVISVHIRMIWPKLYFLDIFLPLFGKNMTAVWYVYTYLLKATELKIRFPNRASQFIYIFNYK